MDKLYFLTGSLQGATAELIGEEITIGRASDNGICIDDESVSDHHAVINRQNKECILRDLQSAKGTTVQGNKVIVVTLEDSNRIAFGFVEAEFTTTEVKLQMPKTAVLPQPPMQPTWPQPKSASARSGGSSFISAVSKLVQLAVLVAVAGGGYWWYQKLSKADPNGDAPAAEDAKVTPLLAPSPSSTAVAVRSPAPEAPAAPAAPAPMPEPVTPAPAAPRVITPVASAPSNPAIQQAMLLIAQNRPQDAIVALDKVIASATNPAVTAEAQAPLKQALDAQFASLQSTKQQWQAQCKVYEDRLKTAQERLAQDTQALEKKKADEAMIQRTGGGYWFNGRYVYNTRKGSGDSSAQSAIQGLQIQVMTGTQEVKKQTELVSRYQPQILALDQQIAAVQARLTQVEAYLNAQSNSGTERVQNTAPPPSMSFASAPPLTASPALPEPASAGAPGAPQPEPAPLPVSSVAAPAPAPSGTVAATPQSSAGSVELDDLKPEDWVRSLPAQAQSAYLMGFNQQGTARVDSLRHWLSLWSKHLQDPNLTLLELDYINQMVQHRDPSINRALADARENRFRISQSEWGTIHQSISRKMTDLTSAGNKLTAMNLRSGKQLQLAKLIGEGVNLAAKERAEMYEIVEHYKSLCRRYRWRYSWYW